MKPTKIGFGVAVVLLLAGAVFLFWQKTMHTPQPVACTMEAKLCPDGSAVGRSGPNCEFAPCPTSSDATSSVVDSTWETTTNATSGVLFSYPPQLQTIYMEAIDWPPQVRVQSGPFTCTEGGSSEARAGLTQQRTIGNRIFCVTEESEGAAGSVYTQYAYATALADKVVLYTFSIRSVQCDNYDEPQKTACKNERASFDIDQLMNRIVATTHL